MDDHDQADRRLRLLRRVVHRPHHYQQSSTHNISVSIFSSCGSRAGECMAIFLNAGVSCLSLSTCPFSRLVIPPCLPPFSLLSPSPAAPCLCTQMVAILIICWSCRTAKVVDFPPPSLHQFRKASLISLSSYEHQIDF
jgi:hypothetical protein